MKDSHLTVDVNVIMIGTGMSDRPCLPCHCGLLDAFAKTVFLAIDHGGHIRQHYQDKLGSFSAGSIWLTKLAKAGRIAPFAMGKLKQSTKVKLDRASFHWADSHFVRLASSTPCKRLVSEDGDFSTKVKKVLVDEEGVIVHDASEVYELILQSCTEEANSPDANPPAV